MNLNLLAPLWCAQSAHKVMAVQEDGGCHRQRRPACRGCARRPGASAYGAAKAGLINLTATLAVEWAPLVRVNCVTAGLLDTGAGDDFYGGPEGMERVAATVPARAHGHARPTWPRPACSSPAPAASFVSGANLVRPRRRGAAGRTSRAAGARRSPQRPFQRARLTAAD